jgi:hypothetical protein
MRDQILTLLILFITVSNSFAIDSNTKLTRKNITPTGIKIGLNESRDLHIPPPACFTDKSGNLAGKANFVVKFDGFSNQTRAAFNYATSIWESLINTPVDIRVIAYWRKLEGSTLASCGAKKYYLGYDGMSYPDTYYPVSLAEKMTGKQLNDSLEYDLEVNINSETNWYYGTDGKTPADKYDLVSVLLHEFCHGLGFTESFYVKNGLGGWGLSNGYGLIYDKFVTDSKGRHITDTTIYPINSKELKDVLTGRVLYFEGPYLMGDFGKKVSLYAPSSWESGSSISHLSTSYSTGSNPLMTPFSYKGESIHDPGVVAVDVLSDLGWKQIFIDHEPITDTEDIKDVTIEAKIYSDFDSDIFNPKLFYSIDSAEYIEKDFVKSSSDNSKFSAKIPVSKSCNISYYLTADDKYNRKYTIPVYAIDQSYGFYVGADTIDPEITHYPNSFLLPGQDSILINAFVYDGIGIDSVWVEYSHNDVMQTPVGMTLFKETQYQLDLDISSLNINDGDSIKYRIVARDKSKAGNTSYLPDSGWTLINVEAIPEYVDNFENNFEATNTDFILQGFTFETPDGFNNGALHSVHPYMEAGENNYLEYIAQIRYPVKVSETNHFISFDEIVLVEPGDAGTVYGDEEFWDYVIVEASKDDGKTWSYLEPGWDCRINTEWYNSYSNLMDVQFSKAIGTQDMYKNHLIDILSSGRLKPGDEIILRFRLYSDPYANGWGWAIDNLKIQTEGLAAKNLALNSEIKIYPNPVEGNMIQISTKDTKIEEVSLFNMQGSMVFRTNEVLNDGIVYLPNMLKGGYIVIVKTNNQTSHSKLLIK